MNGWRWALLVVVVVISLAAGLATPHDAAHDQWWNRIPAFFALFGLGGCLLIIICAKALGKALLQKREGYYDAD
ncbi:MAG: hypothetical protein ACD_75C00479G0002 [uncultured bacterium]|nr:MAG: hypothetical protein ACD_75C00479G0002 [uncultured bacterium]